MRNVIVMTTINRPEEWLRGYVDNILLYGHRNYTGIVIVGDLKTPDLSDLAAHATSWGVYTRYLDVNRQRAFLSRFPGMEKAIPYNSDNRRNVGFLLALEDGAERVISLDDDNFVEHGDFIGEHARVSYHPLADSQDCSYSSPDGWQNIMALLDCGALTIYPRGFPVSKRGPGIRGAQILPLIGHLAANAGLWLGDPDIDACTRIAMPVQATGTGINHYLAPGTWAPLNTQNTCVAREAMPAWYFVYQGGSVNGHRIDRYGDIFSGYFLRRCIDHMGGIVRYGTPYVRQIRNQHDLLQDLQQEVGGMIVTEWLVEALRGITLTGSSYSECYAQLLQGVRDRAQTERPEADLGDYFAEIERRATVWLEAVQKVL